ncbi:MAG: hypothetical protein QF682_10835 [Candidatus Thermoplasmatota archaeon]|nr:hypothetical protein [Candidatus Thermoplasmatota archaeon]
MIVIILLPAVEAGSGSNNQQILNTPTGQGQGQGQGQGYQGQQGQQGEQGEQYWRTIQEYYPTQAQELFYGIYPNETVISTIIDVTYSKAEMEYLYILDYSAAFVFNNTENITVYIPLPAGSIEDLVILVNNEPIGHPTIKSNQVIVPLYAVDAPHTLNVAYLAQGTDLYAHYIPKNVFLDKFYVEIELKNVRYDKRIPDNCLTPDEFISSNPSSYFKWDKENTILKEDITLEISTPDEDKVQVKEEKKEIPWNKIFIIGSTLLVFCLIIALFYYHAFKQPAGRWKLNVSYLFIFIHACCNHVRSAWYNDPTCRRFDCRA